MQRSSICYFNKMISTTVRSRLSHALSVDYELNFKMLCYNLTLQQWPKHTVERLLSSNKNVRPLWQHQQLGLAFQSRHLRNQVRVHAKSHTRQHKPLAPLREKKSKGSDVQLGPTHFAVLCVENKGTVKRHTQINHAMD